MTLRDADGEEWQAAGQLLVNVAHLDDIPEILEYQPRLANVRDLPRPVTVTRARIVEN